MSSVSIQQMADRVAALMEERLRIKGKGLAEKLRRGGRVLPRRVRQAAQTLAECTAQAQSPKLMQQIDHAKLDAAYHLCQAYLGHLGASERRWAAITGFAASLALITLVVFGLVVGVLVWRGYL